MSHQGRCSAIQTAIPVTILLLHLFLSIVSAQKTTYTVGDDSGWTFNVENWTDGKKFRAGDVLFFNYDPSFHNVVVVDVNEYSSCSASSSSSETLTTGKDRVKLVKGLNYFICSVSGHCDGGVKIAVDAS